MKVKPIEVTTRNVDTSSTRSFEQIEDLRVIAQKMERLEGIITSLQSTQRMINDKTFFLNNLELEGGGKQDGAGLAGRMEKLESKFVKITRDLAD